MIGLSAIQKFTCVRLGEVSFGIPLAVLRPQRH
jgi:hypothetical protein